MAKEEKPICHVDPVCNIDLEAGHGKFTYDFEEQTYYFCSEACQAEFASRPKEYAGKDKA